MVSFQFFSAGAGSFAPQARPHGFQPQVSTPTTPWLLDTLFCNLSYDLEQVADVIDPILTAQNHCYRTDWYVQGIVSGETAFISTNLTPDRTIQVSLCGTRWLLGHGPRCHIALTGPAVADCHAALSFDPRRGFFLGDLGSTGGTRVNGRPLAIGDRQGLQDGDLVQMGSRRFEFLYQRCQQPAWDDV